MCSSDNKTLQTQIKRPMTKGDFIKMADIHGDDLHATSALINYDTFCGYYDISDLCL